MNWSLSWALETPLNASLTRFVIIRAASVRITINIDKARAAVRLFYGLLPEESETNDRAAFEAVRSS